MVEARASRRACSSFVFIAPLATCMGMVFPTGVRLLDRAGLAAIVPWMWGVNGFAAVVASVVGMMIAMAWGYTAVIGRRDRVLRAHVRGDGIRRKIMTATAKLSATCDVYIMDGVHSWLDRGVLFRGGLFESCHGR